MSKKIRDFFAAPPPATSKLRELVIQQARQELLVPRSQLQAATESIVKLQRDLALARSAVCAQYARENGVTDA
jgi:hypothetical protein